MATRGTNLFKAKLVAASSVTDVTQTRYARQWQLWVNYCQKNSVGIWAGTSEDLLAFLQSEYSRSGSLAIVYQRLSAVSFFYRLKGLVSPSSGPAVSMYLKGLKRRQLESGPVVRRAKPLTKNDLNLLNDYLLSDDRSLRDWRTIWRINLAFYCLLRWDDVVRLTVADFHLADDSGRPCFDFRLIGGKTLMCDKNLNRRLHSQPENRACPLNMTLKYFSLLGASYTGSVVPQCHPGDKNSPHPQRVINYSSAIEDLRRVLGLVGINASGYSEHSMRRGGATEAARSGATTCEIQFAGNWASRKTAEKYIEASHRRSRDFNKYLSRE